MGIIERMGAIEKKVDDLQAQVGLQDERISGTGGILKAVAALGEEVTSMKRALWTVAGGIVIASVGFAFTILQVVHP